MAALVFVVVDKTSIPGTEIFERFHVFFNYMKLGWKEGCRRVIGMDGCFLKGICKGQLLVAISKDGNEQMYPLAWSVVDLETKASWTKFIKCLIEDFELGQGEGLTIVSNMQKVRNSLFHFIYVKHKCLLVANKLL